MLFLFVLFAFIGMVVPAALGVCVDLDVFVYRLGCRIVTIVFAHFVSIDAPSPPPPRPFPPLVCGARAACVVCVVRLPLNHLSPRWLVGFRKLPITLRPLYELYDFVTEALAAEA